MTASTPKKLKYLTVKEKFEIVQRKEKNESVKVIVEAFKCSKTQVYDVIKNKDKIKQDYYTVKNVNRKKLRVRIPNQRLNMCVYDWYKAAKSDNVPLTGPMLQSKAKEVAKILNIERFSASNGWLESFKRRNCINFSGSEIKPMDQEDIKSWCKNFEHVIKDYTNNDMEDSSFEECYKPNVISENHCELELDRANQVVTQTKTDNIVLPHSNEENQENDFTTIASVEIENSTTNPILNYENHNNDLSTREHTEITESSNDEFFAYGQSIAMQLKKLPLEIALSLQTKFQSMISKQRLLVLKSEAANKEKENESKSELF